MLSHPKPTHKALLCSVIICVHSSVRVFSFIFVVKVISKCGGRVLDTTISESNQNKTKFNEKNHNEHAHAHKFIHIMTD